MLVLTTMFINVSNNLPKTSYIKMMDIWLIFNLLLPFIEILLHTYMDMLRFINPVNLSGYWHCFHCRSEEGREINHHGRPVKTDEDSGDNSNKVHYKINERFFPSLWQVSPMTPVSVNEGGIGGSIKLISRNEKTQVQALKDHYMK